MQRTSRPCYAHQSLKSLTSAGAVAGPSTQNTTAWISASSPSTLQQSKSLQENTDAKCVTDCLHGMGHVEEVHTTQPLVVVNLTSLYVYTFHTRFIPSTVCGRAGLCSHHPTELLTPHSGSPACQFDPSCPHHACVAGCVSLFWMSNLPSILKGSHLRTEEKSCGTLDSLPGTMRRRRVTSWQPPPHCQISFPPTSSKPCWPRSVTPRNRPSGHVRGQTA